LFAQIFRCVNCHQFRSCLSSRVSGSVKGIRQQVCRLRVRVSVRTARRPHLTDPLRPHSQPVTLNRTAYPISSPPRTLKGQGCRPPPLLRQKKAVIPA
jgi:hypothetical protein